MTDSVTGSAANRRWLSTLVYVLSGLVASVALGFWFVAIWTHGHDATTRVAGTGCLVALVAGALAGLAALARGAGQ